MNIVQEISIWAKQLPDWQSDVVRRLFTQEKLTASDENQITRLLLEAHGIIDNDLPRIFPSPFSTIVESQSAVKRTVLVSEIHSLENVNALVSGQSIKFCLDGMTIVYGENGAGKSGYARVFKHACQARDKGDPILVNVLKPVNTKPKATIELLVDGKNVAFQWTSGAAVSDVLGEVAVFDSHCARVFVDDANEVVYLPYGLDVFPKLAALCTTLKEKISAEIRRNPTQFEQAAQYSDSSAAGRVVRSLTAESDIMKLDSLAMLSEVEVARLEELRALVASAKTDSPKAKASQLRRTKARFEQLIEKMTSIATILSEESLATLEELRIGVNVAKDAADLACNDAFKGDPLKATGTDPWRLLFDAAKAFSEQAAYPAEPFPVVRNGAVCLLCQQPLASDSADRLVRFEQFIKNDTERRHSEAVSRLTAEAALVDNVAVNWLDNDHSLMGDIQAVSNHLANNVRLFFLEYTSLKDSVSASLALNKKLPLKNCIYNPTGDIKKEIDKMEVSAKQYDEAENPEEFKRISYELVELIDRDCLKAQLKSVKNFIALKQRESRLKKCEKALETNSITKYGSEFMERAVKEHLMKQLKKELDWFGLRSAPVQVKKSGQKGKTKHQLVVADSVKPSKILSEGEQRVIAISSFLAEISASGSASPIIFDDPVSSLDHRHREMVAKRLVEESKSRQVIVFTHDIVMLLALEREAAEQQAPLLIQNIAWSPTGPGECASATGLPWHACATSQRLGSLRNESAKFKRIHSESPSEYEKHLTNFYGKLRETWERAIEEVLLNDVIQRFRPSIETQRLKSVIIEEGDYVVIENAMGKCSTWLTGHDSAGAIGSQVPSPDEVAADLKNLDEFVKGLKKRAEDSRKATGALIKAPSPKVSNQRASEQIELSSLNMTKQIGA